MFSLDSLNAHLRPNKYAILVMNEKLKNLDEDYKLLLREV
jgi:hypothetical protein